MMKTLFTISFALLFACGGYAQNLRLTRVDNKPLAGDSIIKQQVAYKDPSSSGRNLMWDFRLLNPVNESYTLHYFRPKQADTTLVCGLEHGTRYYYRLLNDSLYLTGYENPTTYVEYFVPELRMRFPLVYGDTLASRFAGTGEYCHRIALQIKGHSRTTVDAEGVLMLPDGIRIERALRVYTLRQYTETGKDSLAMTMKVYAWYAVGNRYPVFESIESITHKISGNGTADSTIYTTSFYYPPTTQQTQINPEAAFDAQLSGSDDETASDSGIRAVVSRVSTLPNPVETTLHISFTLKRDASMRFVVHNGLGVPVYGSLARQYAAGSHSINVNMSNQSVGVYTLYVHADDMVESLNIIKK